MSVRSIPIYSTNLATFEKKKLHFWEPKRTLLKAHSARARYYVYIYVDLYFQQISHLLSQYGHF